MDIKITLPLLPLRDIVVFPSMVIPLFVGRDKSIMIDLSLPTNKGITILGKTTISLNGNNGNVIFISIREIWILYFIMQ